MLHIFDQFKETNLTFDHDLKYDTTRDNLPQTNTGPLTQMFHCLQLYYQNVLKIT